MHVGRFVLIEKLEAGGVRYWCAFPKIKHKQLKPAHLSVYFDWQVLTLGPWYGSAAARHIMADCGECANYAVARQCQGTHPLRYRCLQLKPAHLSVYLDWQVLTLGPWYGSASARNTQRIFLKSVSLIYFSNKSFYYYSSLILWKRKKRR